MKNILDSCFAALAFYVFGYGLAFGVTQNSNWFIGTNGFALVNVQHMYQWFIQFTYCNNAASIFGGE